MEHFIQIIKNLKEFTSPGVYPDLTNLRHLHPIDQVARKVTDKAKHETDRNLHREFEQWEGQHETSSPSCFSVAIVHVLDRNRTHDLGVHSHVNKDNLDAHKGFMEIYRCSVLRLF